MHVIKHLLKKIPHRLFILFQWTGKHLECLLWLLAILLLYFMPVNKPAPSLCIFSLLGFGNCPGCGIGHAIHFALRLQFATSLYHHPLGIFAVIVIFRRIIQLIKKPIYCHETKPD